MLNQAGRVPGLLALARETNRARALAPGVIPDGDDLVALQSAAWRAGGLAGLVAEALASYTGLPIDPEPKAVDARTRTVAGRTATVPSDDSGASVSWPARQSELAIDATLVGLVLGGGLRLVSSKLEFLNSLLGALASDVKSNWSTATVVGNLEGLDAAFASIGAPMRLERVEVLRGCDRDDMPDAEDVLSVRMSMRPGAGLTEHAVVSLATGGLVHGRIGATGAADASWWTCTHWEAARRVSPECRDFLVRVIVESDRASPDVAALVTLGTGLGIPEQALGEDLRRLLELLAPLGTRLRPLLSPGRDIGSNGLTLVPNPLGVMYGLADLLALRALC